MCFDKGGPFMLTNEKAASELLSKNLTYIIKNEYPSQKAFAEKMEIAQATLVKILKSGQIPSIYPFFYNLEKEPQYTMSEVLSTDIAIEDEKDFSADVSREQADKLCGLYCFYYYDTAAFKGRDNKEAKEALNSGLLLVYRNRESKEYVCMAQFGMKVKEMREKFLNCGGGKIGTGTSLDTIAAKMKSYSSVHLYQGTLKITSGHVYLTLDYGDKDHAFVVLHRPDGTGKYYIGGLGAMVSTSKGRTSFPCMQMLGLSRFNMDISEEEIARKLLLGYPSIKPGDKCEPLMTLIKQLYQNHSESENVSKNFEIELSDIYRESLIQGEVTRLINSIVESNVFRTIKISYIDDDEWYHFVKKFNPRNRG